MKAYTLIVILFLASLVMFFVGAIIGNISVSLAGLLLTFGLFLGGRFFKGGN